MNKEDKKFIEIDGKKIYSLDEISHEQVLREMPYKELLRRRMNEVECGRQARLLSAMIRELHELSDKFTDEEYYLVDKVRNRLQGDFNGTWYRMSDVLKESIDKRVYIECKEEQQNENG